MKNKILFPFPFVFFISCSAAFAEIDFRVEPESPTADDPLNLFVSVPGGHPDTSYSSSASYQRYGPEIFINLVTNRSTDGIFLPIIGPAGGQVQVGKVPPGYYEVFVNWYRSYAPWNPLVPIESQRFTFKVGLGDGLPVKLERAVALSFETDSEKRYQIYRSTDMEEWVPHGEVIMGDGNPHFYYERTAGERRGFFKVISVD